jgi:L-cystine uptake protein TcyP (sodium:dicarboxylate symporter family)
MARTTGNAPRNITWIICLVLYVIALVAHFGIVHVGGDIATWSWIIGFGLLLVAVRVRGL